MAHILNAEAEKIQFVVGTLEVRPGVVPTIPDILTINSSVRRTMQDVIKKEMLLQFKLENVLSIIYLKDALSWELIAFKKLHAFAQQATDPEVKQALEKAGQMHQQHYQKLLTHLQNNNTAVMSTLPQTQSQQQQQPQMQ